MYIKQTILLILILTITACTDLNKVESRVNLQWNYDYSSDVIHGIVVANDISESNSGNCKVHYSTFKVIESFKGNFKEGDILNAVGIDAHEYTNEGSEQFLLLIPFIATRAPGFGDCIDNDYKHFLVIHNWCCSIDATREKSLVMYDMLNSETASENYLVPTRKIFEHLRKLRSSSNKSLQPTAESGG